MRYDKIFYGDIMIKQNTICALSTASGVGGVAIIRVSGENSISLLEKFFKPVNKINPRNFEPYKLYPGEFINGDFKDFGMAVYFKGPKSYTGEDMVEFHCHGGIAITRNILSSLLNAGATIADRGEFTKRAFINGKLSLSSAEGLIDMINAESDALLKAGYSLYREKLLSRVKSMQEILKNILAEIDANIDFPEYDLEEYQIPDILDRLKKIQSDLSIMISTFNSGKLIKNGVNVVLCGKPNTGKSSLLNALLDYDKAIISSVAGTTRDVVEGQLVINGIIYNLYDTAGIRESENEIETLGIERSKKMIESANLIIFMLDSDREVDEEDIEIYNSIKDKNHIVVFNKCDKSNKFVFDKVDIKISAKTGENVDKLKSLMEEKVLGSGGLTDGEYIIEERHSSILKSTKEDVDEAISEIEANVPVDAVSIDLKSAWSKLGEISGESANERIIDEIFSKFCVGK